MNHSLVNFCPPAVAGCRDVCEQCARIAACLAPDLYAARWKGHQAIGPHLRHCVDHFRSFFRDLPGGCIDYDARDRDPRLECDPAFMCAALDEIRTELDGLAPKDLGRALRVRLTPAPGMAPRESESSVERELLFLMGHTMHHLALVAVLMECHGLEPPRGVGVAYSTQAHRAAQPVHAA